jgi:hypothetical protein
MIKIKPGEIGGALAYMGESELRTKLSFTNLKG